MSTCSSCSTSIPDGHEHLLIGKGKNASQVPFCANCAADLDGALRAETENPNLYLAIVLGLAAAVVCSLAWYGLVVVTHYELGIAAIAVGWLVSQAVIRGAGNKRGRVLQLAAIVIVVAAMAFSEYLIIRHLLVEALSQGGRTIDVPYLLPLDVIVELIWMGIEDDPLTLVFWAIAVFQAWTVPAARTLRWLKPEERWTAAPNVG